MHSSGLEDTVLNLILLIYWYVIMKLIASLVRVMAVAYRLLGRQKRNASSISECKSKIILVP